MTTETTTQSPQRLKLVQLPDFPAISPVKGAGVINTPSANDLLELPADREEHAAALDAGIAFSKADIGMRSLQMLEQLLDSDLGADEYRAAVAGVAKASEAALEKGLAAVRESSKQFKKSWLEFAAMAELATSHAGPFGIANCSAEKLRCDVAVRERLLAQIPKGTAFDQSKLAQLIVLPDWPGNESALRAMGVEALLRRATLVTAFPDMPLADALKALANGGRYGGLRGSDPWHKNALMAGNHMELQDGTVLSPAPMLAGLLLRNAALAGSSIAVTPAGYEHPVELSFADGARLRWDITDAALPMGFRDAIVPLVNYKQRKVFWAAKSLSTNETGDEYFAVFRTRLYLEKVLADYLNQKAFKVIGTTQAKQIHAALAELLRKVTGDGDEFLLLAGQVLGVTPSPQGPQICDVKLQLQFKIPTGIFRVTMLFQASRSAEGGSDVRSDPTS